MIQGSFAQGGNPLSRMVIYPEAGHGIRLALVAAGLLNIVLLAGVVNVIGYLAFADANNASSDIPMAGLLTVLAWLSLPLAGGLIFFAARAYCQGQWSRLVRGIYALVAAAAVAFTGFLAYWNVLALPF